MVLNLKVLSFHYTEMTTLLVNPMYLNSVSDQELIIYIGGEDFTIKTTCMKCHQRKSKAKKKNCLSRCCTACITKRKTDEKKKSCLETRLCPTNLSWTAGFAGADWNERKGKGKKIEDDVDCRKKCNNMVKPYRTKPYSKCLRSCCDVCNTMGYTKKNVQKCFMCNSRVGIW